MFWLIAVGPQQLCGNPGIQLFKLLRRHVVTVIVNPDCVIEVFNVLENQPVRMNVTLDTESVQPFPLDERMKLKAALIDFRSFYGLEKNTLKELDKYLWQLGKECFPKLYVDKNKETYLLQR